MLKKIVRENYLKQMIAFKDKQIIKIITGIRRCGKSTLMELYQDYLLAEGVKPKQIIAINLEDFDFHELKLAKNLHSYIKDRLVLDEMNYIFIDEIQQCTDFQLVVDSLYIKKNIDIYITGSNAHILSSELATLLSGRYIEIKMLPLSFKEYVDATAPSDNLQAKYNDYLLHSSFPYALAFDGQIKEIKKYLDGIYNSIIVKDILQKNSITNTMMLESIVRFIFDSIGSQISTNKIARTMTSNGRKIDAKTVEKYLTALLESYVIYQAKRYDIKGKQYLKTLEKYYVVDIGLRFYLLGNRKVDIGHILENVVYLELIRREYDVYIGKIDEFEVDFVASNHNEQAYYQVAASVRDENTLARELRSLQKITDNYPKYILTFDQDPVLDYDGIIIKNALEWLIDY